MRGEGRAERIRGRNARVWIRTCLRDRRTRRIQVRDVVFLVILVW